MTQTQFLLSTLPLSPQQLMSCIDLMFGAIYPFFESAKMAMQKAQQHKMLHQKDNMLNTPRWRKEEEDAAPPLQSTG
jgi:hypothetical protein